MRALAYVARGESTDKKNAAGKSTAAAGIECRTSVFGLPGSAASST